MRRIAPLVRGAHLKVRPYVIFPGWNLDLGTWILELCIAYSSPAIADQS
jgi:hypothetical protein